MSKRISKKQRAADEAWCEGLRLLLAVRMGEIDSRVERARDATRGERNRVIREYFFARAQLDDFEARRRSVAGDWTKLRREIAGSRLSAEPIKCVPLICNEPGLPVIALPLGDPTLSGSGRGRRRATHARNCAITIAHDTVMRWLKRGARARLTNAEIMTVALLVNTIEPRLALVGAGARLFAAECARLQLAGVRTPDVDGVVQRRTLKAARAALLDRSERGRSEAQRVLAFLVRGLTAEDVRGARDRAHRDRHRGLSFVPEAVRRAAEDAP